MSNTKTTPREGSLEAPTRHPLDWKSETFYDEGALFEEMERVFDICHGCRRCFSLCNSFPTLFDAVDESETLEVDGVPKAAYWDVVDHCYLCDMCYMSKCPYVPPHEWNVDFPHLMLRAKAVGLKKGRPSTRDKILSATDTVGSLAGIPVVNQVVNAVNRSATGRKMVEKALGVHPNAPVPQYQSKSLRKRVAARPTPAPQVTATEHTRGRVAMFHTCYGNRIDTDLGTDLMDVFEHNGIEIRLSPKEQCCGMPKLELGDLEAVERAKQANIPMLAALVDEGYDIVSPIPSCVLMFKQELPLMFPHDPQVAKVKAAIFDPFEYLMLRHRDGALNTDFKKPLGTVAYHVACHLRVQNIGLKTRDLLSLIPQTNVESIERCSGHDGTYAVKSEYHETSLKIARPVARKVTQSNCDYYASDCPMAGRQIETAMEAEQQQPPTHPLRLLRLAYGLGDA